MSKQEFLQRLRMALNGEISGSVIEENIRYYDEYISTEVARGQTEEAVTASIGDPRLIAKTILEVAENAEGSAGRGGFRDSRQSEGQTVYEENGRAEKPIHTIDFSKWYWKVVGILAVVLFFIVLSAVVSGLFSLVIPLLGPILMIVFLFRIFRGTRR